MAKTIPCVCVDIPVSLIKKSLYAELCKSMLTYSTRGFDYADGQAEENSTDGDWEGLHSPSCVPCGRTWGAYWSLLSGFPCGIALPTLGPRATCSFNSSE